MNVDKLDLQDAVDICLMTEINELESNLKELSANVDLLMKGVKGEIAFGGKTATDVSEYSILSLVIDSY